MTLVPGFLAHLTQIHLSPMILPALIALAILGLEPLLLAARIFFLIPVSFGVKIRELIPIFFKGQLIANFSIPTLGDVYRFRKLGDLRSPPFSAPDRIQWIAIERLSESVTLPLLGLVFSNLAAVKKLVPLSAPIPIFGVTLGVIVLLFLVRKKKNPALRLNSVPIKSLMIAILISASGWTLDLLALKVLTFPFGIPISELTLALIAVSFSSIPPLPWGRWGLYEGILGAALHRSGIPIETALAIATLFHILTVAPFLAIPFGLWVKNKMTRKLP